MPDVNCGRFTRTFNLYKAIETNLISDRFYCAIAAISADESKPYGTLYGPSSSIGKPYLYVTYSTGGSPPAISGYVRTSGGTGISGVAVSADNGGGSDTTDSSGFYSLSVPYNWSGTVTPSKSGYTFSPANRPYSNVTSNLSNQDYTGTLNTYAISGAVTKGGSGLSGVTMTGLPSSPVTNASGYYSDTVDHGWSGTATPSKSGYTFSPPSTPYSNVTSNMSNQDYTGTLNTYTISGTVTEGGSGLAGVTMNGLPGSPITDGTGYYSDTVDHGWSGTVTPSKSGYTFSPTNRSYLNVTSNLFNQDYTGIPPSNPTISVDTTQLLPSCQEGQNAPSDSFEVWNSGTGTLNYTISDDAGWLSCSPTSGSSTGEHDTITVTYSTSGLSPGAYSATITISDPVATNNPQTISVNLTVGFHITGTISYNRASSPSTGKVVGACVQLLEKVGQEWVKVEDKIDYTTDDGNFDLNSCVSPSLEQLGLEISAQNEDGSVILYSKGFYFPPLDCVIFPHDLWTNQKIELGEANVNIEINGNAGRAFAIFSRLAKANKTIEALTSSLNIKWLGEREFVQAYWSTDSEVKASNYIPKGLFFPATISYSKYAYEDDGTITHEYGHHVAACLGVEASKLDPVENRGFNESVGDLFGNVGRPPDIGWQNDFIDPDVVFGFSLGGNLKNYETNSNNQYDDNIPEIDDVLERQIGCNAIFCDWLDDTIAEDNAHVTFNNIWNVLANKKPKTILEFWTGWKELYGTNQDMLDVLLATGVDIDEATATPGSGGTASINGASIDIPVGAVTTSRDFLLSATTSQDSVTIVSQEAELLPADGLGEINLTQPAALTIPYDSNGLTPSQESSLAIHHYDEANEVWASQVSAVNTSAKTVSTQLMHFSKYAVGLPELAEEPNEPNGFNLVDNIATSGSIKLTWNANTESDLAGYVLKLIRSSDPNGYQITTEPNATTYIIQAIEPDNYEFRLSASDVDRNRSSPDTTTLNISDTDADGLADVWETTQFGNLTAEPNQDTDSDDANNLTEYRYGTEPNNPDSDADIMPDGWEIYYGLAPLDANDANKDSDGDSGTNVREYRMGGDPTDPFSPVTGTSLAWGGGKCPAAKDVVSVAAGWSHSLGLKTDGSIVAWGYNNYGQCNIPSPNTGFTAVAAGYIHSLGLKEDGSIVAWGYDYWGQCNPPSLNTGFVAVAAGGYHSLGLKADGSIDAWGYNNYGQGNVPSPNTGFTGIATGGYHSLGLKENGSVVAWGNNDDDQCYVPSPNSGFTGIAAGKYHNLGLKENGSVVAWGANWFGQCTVPSPNTDFTAVAAGYGHSLGLKEDGSIVAWGYNNYGQCNVPSPNTGFTAVAGGYNHSLGLKQDGSIVAWGYNYYGQCNLPSPNTGFVAIAAGESHSLGLKSDGSIVAWGDNGWRQCDVPDTTRRFVAISTSGYHNIAIVSSIEGDFDGSLREDFVDFSLFASHWMESCNPANRWCDGADLDKLGSVDIIDLMIFTEHWLESIE